MNMVARLPGIILMIACVLSCSSSSDRSAGVLGPWVVAVSPDDSLSGELLLRPDGTFSRTIVSRMSPRSDQAKVGSETGVFRVERVPQGTGLY